MLWQVYLTKEIGTIDYKMAFMVFGLGTFFRLPGASRTKKPKKEVIRFFYQIM